MSNENLPMRWDEEMAKHAKAVAAVERPALSMISLQAGQMKLAGQLIPGNRLPCIIVASAFQQRYYVSRFDPNKPATPVCFALSRDGQDMAPHETSSQKQNEDCLSCPQNRWGSDPTPGRKGKACRLSRRLALLPADSVKDGTVERAEMAILTVPVTSLKHWSAFVNQCNAEHQRPPWGMLAAVSTHPSQNQFDVKFEILGLVGEEALPSVYKRISQAEEVILSPYDNAEQEPQAPREDSKARKF